MLENSTKMYALAKVNISFSVEDGVEFIVDLERGKKLDFLNKKKLCIVIFWKKNWEVPFQKYYGLGSSIENCKYKLKKGGNDKSGCVRKKKLEKNWLRFILNLTVHLHDSFFLVQTEENK